MGGPPTHRRRAVSRAGGATASLTTLALAATLLAAHPSAAAPPGHVPRTPLAAAEDELPSGGAEGQSPEQAAVVRAKLTGQPVPVPERTTETDTVVANPDGSLGLTRSAVPVRVKQADWWVDLDATLVVGGDGRIRPKAALTTVEFSGGGTTPLARLEHGGKRLALSWPTALPTPQLSGPSALYANVLPDVDLKVTATDEGGFSHVLIVKTPAAARDPRLATLKLGTDSDTLDVTEKPDGTIVAQTPDGQAQFIAPPPIMWDSRTSPATAPAASMPATSAATAAADDEPAAPEAGPAAAEQNSDASRPGPDAAVAPLNVTVTAEHLVLTPDQGLLTAADTQFPVYIDPTWVPANRGSSLYTWVQSAYDTTPGYGRTDYNPGVGYQQWRQKTGVERSFWRVPVGLPGTLVKKAHFYVTETYSAAFSCTAAYPVTLYLTGVISEGTTWINQPGTIENWGTLNVAGAGHTGCGDRLVDYDVTNQIAARAGWTDVTLGLRANETVDADNIAFKRFGKNASLYIEYNTTPNAPTDLQISPVPQNPACGGWIGAVNPAGGGIKLSATLSDPDGHTVNANFHLRDSTAGDALTDYGWGPPLASGARAEQAIGTLVDGHRYYWGVRAGDYDPATASAFVIGCAFGIDRTAPTAPTVTSTQYPPSGTSPGSPLHAGDPGTFTLTATDPLPPGGVTASGIAKFEYALNDAIPVGGASSVPAGGGTANLTLTPTRWGTNLLYVQAVDNAGNRSQTRAYSFYVPYDPNRSSVAGDVTGDGTPDLLLPDSGGKLVMYQTTKDPSAPNAPAQTAATMVSLPEDAPDNNDTVKDGKGWTTTLTSHTTSTGNFTDDLWAYKAGKLFLYRHTNNPKNDDATEGLANTQGQYFAASNRAPVSKAAAGPCVGDCTTYWATDWTRVLQIAALSVPVPGADPPYRTDLLTVEDDDGQPGGTASLWHYTGGGSPGTLGTIRRLGTGWQDYTLTAPGNATGDAMPDLWARNTKTGELYQYDGNFVPDGLSSHDARTRIGGGLTAAAYPTVVSDGDIVGSTHKDLWTAAPNGHLTLYPGKALSGDNAFDAGVPIAYSTAGCQTLPGVGGDKKLCGAILAKYLALRAQGVPVGLPETESLNAPDNSGRYALFRTPGATTADAAIYWYPDTGAQWVNGGIRSKWQSLGAENSYLGYPTSDEFPVAGGMRSSFQGGYIRWTASTGANADHTYWDGETPTAHLTVTGDFNGDGRTDLATVIDYQNASAGLWTSLTTNTGGASAPFESWKTGAGTWVITGAKWVAGDFNNDGRDDIAALYDYGNGMVRLHTFTAKSDNSGGFNTPVQSWEQASGWDWARTTLMAGNADGAGADELVAVQGTADGRFSTHTFTATATGTFNAPVKSYEVPQAGWWYTNQSHFALGDANGDGRADLIGTYVYADGTLKTFTALANPGGTYPAPAIAGWASNPGGWEHHRMQATAGDINGDGRADLIVEYDYDGGIMGLWTFAADTTGNLSAPVQGHRSQNPGDWYAANSVPHAGDTNNDGRADVITLYNYGNSTFASFIFTAKTGDPNDTLNNGTKTWEAPIGTW